MRKRKTKTLLPKVSGRRVKNKSEYDCFLKLKNLLPSRVKVEYEPIDIPYTTQGKYKVDFVLTFPKKDGRIIYIEYKGNGRAFSTDVRRKMISVKEQHPEKDLKIIFHSDGAIGPKRKDGSRMRQSDWAKKHGFDFCIGLENIPEEWFE